VATAGAFFGHEMIRSDKTLRQRFDDRFMWIEVATTAPVGAAIVVLFAKLFW
jgi:hypothetical protein